MDAKKLIQETISRIKAGTLTDFSPLIALFQYERKPMTLDGHFMFLPLFSLERPKYLTLRCGRQVSKSYTLAETQFLTTGMIESFNSIYIAPRYDQLKRFHNQVLSPLIKTSPAAPLLIDKSGSDAIEMKSFLNGNTLMLEHSFNSPDRVRGASNCSAMALDESTSGDTKILIFHLTLCQDGVYYISDRPEIVPISEVKRGDIVMSFTSEGCIYSPVVRDASYHGRRAVFKVTTQSGRSLCCTADHMLQTNMGGMRISEVIEYGCDSRNGARTSAEGRDQRFRVERDCGDNSGGCECAQTSHEGQCKLGPSVEPRDQAERLPGVQSEHIIRARYWTSVCETESRLRRLLGDAENQGFKDIYIACMDGVSDGRCTQDDYRGTTEAADAPHRPCVVVRRRWQSCKWPKRRAHCYKRVYQGGSNTPPRLVIKRLGHHCHLTRSKALEHGALCNNISSTQNRIYKIFGTNTRVSSGINEIQAYSCQTHLRTLRKRIHYNKLQRVLLGGMSTSIPTGVETRVLRENQGTISSTQISVRRNISGSSSRGDTSKVERSLCGINSRATRTQGTVLERVSGDPQSSAQRTASRVACAHEGGPGVRKQVEGGAPALLPAEDGGSRETCQRIDTSKGLKAKSGTTCETVGVSAQIPGRASGDLCRTTGTCGSTQKRTDAERSGVPGKTPSEGSGDTSSSSCKETVRKAGTRRIVYDRIVSIEYLGEEDVYDIEVVGTHNYVLANGMCSYNCQDINPDFLPVFESTTDASRYGIIQASGTPKTSDTLLELQFSKSSQCHWGIKCPSCSKWNIADVDEQLIGMIGKSGLSCAFCGKILNPREGGWVPKFPERQLFHAGYHVPQIILPMHCENPTKWAVLRSRQAEWTKTRMFNEVLGVPTDDGVKLLTLDDLVKAQGTWENTLESAASLAHQCSTVFVGVDWSGGGGGFSRTAIAVLGQMPGQRDTCVLFLETLPHGLTPEEEADRVAHVYSRCRGNMLAHDYTGAGFVRESVLLGRHPYLREHIYPFAYVFRTGNQLVTYQQSGSRKSANVDKTRSLLLTFNAIRSGLLRVPKFNPADPKAPILEMLNIVERPQEFSKASIKDVYILQRAAGRYDDAAHAINIAYIAQCDLTESWPEFSMDPKYEMTEAALEELTGQTDTIPVL